MYCFQKALVSRKFVTNNSIGGRYLDYCWKFANILNMIPCLEQKDYMSFQSITVTTIGV